MSPPDERARLGGNEAGLNSLITADEAKVDLTPLNPQDDHPKPQLIIGSAAEMVAWLRANLGRGLLADIVRNRAYGMLSIPGLTADGFEPRVGCVYNDLWMRGYKVSAQHLVGLVTARWDCQAKNGRPALLPITAARTVVASPFEIPGVRELTRFCRNDYCDAPLGWGDRGMLHVHRTAVRR